MKKKKIKKLDSYVSNLCNSSTVNDKVSAIIFINKRNKECAVNKLKESGCNIKYYLDLIDAVAIEAQPTLIKKLAEDDDVVYISHDSGVTTCLNVAREAIGADKCPQSGNNVGVAVIDTGIYPHADLTFRKNRVVEFVDFVNGKKKPYDDNGHGTHCAGIIAGDGMMSNGKYTGIAPKANLIGLKVMNAYGEGNSSDILAALEWVNSNRQKYNIRVVSLSFGTLSTGNAFDPLILAVDRLWDKGVVVVAAAGNEGPSLATISSPGASKKIITVGCSDDKGTVDIKDDTIADFSSRGPSSYSRMKPDLVAPGVDIYSLSNAGGYVPMSGTSMSTPIISGCCALLLEKEPKLSPDEVKRRLIGCTDSLNQPYVSQGSGLVNAASLLKTDK